MATTDRTATGARTITTGRIFSGTIGGRTIITSVRTGGRTGITTTGITSTTDAAGEIVTAGQRPALLRDDHRAFGLPTGGPASHPGGSEHRP